jgi:hypothetical protein
VECASITRASYPHVWRRSKGILASNTQGGNNKKLLEPQNDSLKDYLLMCHNLGKSAGIEEVISAANSILRMDRILNEKGEIATTSHRWAHRWIKREHKFLKTLCSKPLSYLRKQAHVKEDIENHFKEFQRCKSHYAIEDEDCYNFDETGCPIGIIAGSIVIVPIGTSTVYVDDLDNKELVIVSNQPQFAGDHIITRDTDARVVGPMPGNGTAWPK